MQVVPVLVSSKQLGKSVSFPTPARHTELNTYSLVGTASVACNKMYICVFFYWRASVASETLTGVKMKKSGMFVYLYIWTYVSHFVL